MSELFLLNGESNCLGAEVTDDKNEPLSIDDKLHKSYWDVDSPLVHVPIVLNKTVTKNYLRDIIPVNFEFALSENFQKVLNGFRVDENAVMQTVRIVNNKKQVLSSNYVLLYSRKWYDVLDREASAAKVFPNGLIDTVRSWVVSTRKIPDLDLFCAHGWHWIVSGNLAKHLANMSNIRLSKIETTA